MKHLVWLVLAVLMVLFYGRHQREVGKLQGQIVYLLKSRAKLDSTYRVEVSEMANQMLHYKNLQRTVRITDTLWVKQFIASADSTITACTDVLGTCEHRVALRDSIISALEKRRPGRFGCVVGGTVNTKGAGPGAACGIRF